MLSDRKALLLVGSPKKSNSSSDSIGSYLLDKLSEDGYATDKLNILSSLKSNEDAETLLEAVNNAELIILTFPLYVDSLPAGVIKSFELIASHREKNKSTSVQRMIAIVNCGFPESLQTKIALDICRCFANSVGFKWAGSLGLSCGGVISGRPIKEQSGMLRNVIKSLDLTSKALVNNNPIPSEAKDLMAKQFIPSRLYTFIGNMGWKKAAKKNGCRGKIYARPYEKSV